MDKETRKKYKAKAKDSFRTKKNLFLFHAAITRKTTISETEFHEFKISVDLVNEYTSEYWQQPLDYEINQVEISEIEMRIKALEKEIENIIPSLEADYISSFPKVYPKPEFKKLLTEKECHYCGITIEQIDMLGEQKKLYKKSLRGWTLEIDRLNSNFEYKPRNCVMSCYWCNNAKTDEFTEPEFLEIGQAIGKIWEERLK